VEQFVATLRGLGLTVDLTVYPEADHFIADEVYGAAELQQWFANIKRLDTAIAV
jgi:dipeptidyl aminopeptidase/acylaminoacyl peptidase